MGDTRTESTANAKVRLFCSYAEKDSVHRDALERHLASLKRTHLIESWDFQKVSAGEVLRTAISQRLEEADIILVLLSSDFLDSYHYDEELTRALARHECGEARLIPVLLRPTDLTGLPIQNLKLLPGGGPVTKWESDDLAWVAVVGGVREAIRELQRARSTQDGSAGTQASAVHSSRELGARLDRLHGQREAMLRRDADIAEIAVLDREIAEVRGQLRRGPQLRKDEDLAGRYRLMVRLGDGGFATVWRALDRQHHDQVAIKVLHGHRASDPLQLARFYRGARAMAGIRHPGIVRVLREPAEEDGFHFFVMAYYPGGDLRRAVEKGALSPEQIVKLISKTGAALQAAHDADLIHRDIKPANILLDARGEPCLTDFDLVWTRDSSGGTGTGALGTFLYSAPEVLHDAGQCSVAADVYSLGMTAIFALRRGALPLAVVRNAEAIIDRLECGAAVRAALKRAVEWEPVRRFASVAEFCLALEAAAREVPAVAVGPPPPPVAPPVEQDPAAAPLLARFSAARTGEERLECAEALVRAIDPPRLPSAVLQMAVISEDADQRARALEVLLSRDDAGARSALGAALVSRFPEVRQRALQQLDRREMAPATVLTMLRIFAQRLARQDQVTVGKLLDTPIGVTLSSLPWPMPRPLVEIRDNVAHAVGRAGAVLPAVLAELLLEDSVEVRQAARWALDLAEVNPRQVIQLLVEEGGRTANAVRVVRALGLLGRASVPALQRMGREAADPLVRRNVRAALDDLGASTRAMLKRRLEDILIFAVPLVSVVLGPLALARWAVVAGRAFLIVTGIVGGTCTLIAGVAAFGAFGRVEGLIWRPLATYLLCMLVPVASSQVFGALGGVWERVTVVPITNARRAFLGCQAALWIFAIWHLLVWRSAAWVAVLVGTAVVISGVCAGVWIEEAPQEGRARLLWRVVFLIGVIVLLCVPGLVSGLVGKGW